MAELTDFSKNEISDIIKKNPNIDWDMLSDKEICDVYVESCIYYGKHSKHGYSFENVFTDHIIGMVNKKLRHAHNNKSAF